MATDARFDVVQKILPHENADSLEVAVVSNFPCIVRKGEFIIGDWCFYIRDDARLMCFDEYKTCQDKDDFTASFPWQSGLIKYLGTNGRVKTVKLRKKISMGILLKPRDVCPNINDFTSDIAEYYNSQILDPENGSLYLKKNFGIEHWTAPMMGCSMGQIDARGPLCDGVQKSDEENFENIDDSEFPWGEDVLETKKLDGTSTTVLSTPEGEVHVMSRSLDMKLECDNVYTRATKDIIPLVTALAKHYNKTIAVRGEVCGQGINANKANKEAKDPLLTFNMYGVNFPNDPDYATRIGLYGTPSHFLEVNKVCKQLTGHEIRTVPILGVIKLTREYLEKVVNMPADIKEGSVFNTKSMTLPHFKAKSREYLMKIG